MRWIPFAILSYGVIVLQTSLGRLLALPTSLGPIGPDFAAIVAIFMAFYARSSLEAMLAAWILGMSLDLTTGGAVGGASVVGPMALAYALGAGLIYRVREAVFRERATTQVLVAIVFTFLTHALWIIVQALRMPLDEWPVNGWVMLWVAGVATYTAVLAPLGHAALWAGRRLWIPSQQGRSR